MLSLIELVAQRVEQHPNAAVERVTFGTADPVPIAGHVETWIIEHLGAPVIAAWLWRVSVGCVAGVSLDDGRDVVVKVYSPDRPPARVAQVLQVQRHARAASVPAAEPITGPHSLDALGHVAAMHSVDWSGPDDPYCATAAECVEFVRAVERARLDRFTSDEWRAARASIVCGWC